MIQSLERELNAQINREFEAAYSYLVMAAYSDSSSLDGFSHWMRLQAQEELLHAMKIYDFVRDRGGRIALSAVKQPSTEFKSPLHMFETALAHENRLADELNSLATLAQEQRDNTTYVFLQWFLTEQVEEIAQSSAIVDKLKMIGDSGQSLFLLNNELKQRQPPVAVP